MPGRVLFLAGRRLGRLIGLAADDGISLGLPGIFHRGRRRERSSLHLHGPVASKDPVAQSIEDIPARFLSGSAARTADTAPAPRPGQPVGKRHRRSGR